MIGRSVAAGVGAQSAKRGKKMGAKKNNPWIL
jgi:hypothetical protein